MPITKSFKLFESSSGLTADQIAFLDKGVAGSWNHRDDSGKVDVKGDFIAPKGSMDFRGIRFGVVDGNFTCKGMNLPTGEGFPDQVTGNLDCSQNSLRSFEKITPLIGGSLNCSYNTIRDLTDFPKVAKSIDLSNNRIRTLSNLPTVVEGDFDCSHNPLISLSGCPKIVNGQFMCVHTTIKTLEGGPEEVKESYLCSKNPQLTTIMGAARKVMGSFVCKESPIESLEGGPEWVGENYYCQSTKIQTMQGCAAHIGKSLNCSSCELYTLEGCPKKIHGSFHCHDNKLENLVGCPEEITAGDEAPKCRVSFKNNSLYSLLGAPEKSDVTSVDLSGNPVSQEALTSIYLSAIKGRSYLMAFADNMNDLEEADWRELGNVKMKRHTIEDALKNISKETFGHKMDFKAADFLQKNYPEIYKIVSGDYKTLDTAASLGDLGF